MLTGLILAFMMRAFLVEPFIIPTGSMAESLLGAHATRTCPACGWEYDFGPRDSVLPSGIGFEPPYKTLCPNCLLGLYPTAEDTIPKAGDRILVHKWPYALGLLEPQRWDLIVFRSPSNPALHYIKRVVGLPGEIIEIVDGDIFINNQIARKPAHIQRGLWFVVFDQGHIANSAAVSGQLPRWVPTDPTTPGRAGWSGLRTRVIRYDVLDEAVRKIRFEPDTDHNYLQDVYGYNCGSSEQFTGEEQFVSDVRLVSELTLEAGTGWCQWELTRPPYLFSARLHRNGMLQLVLDRYEDHDSVPAVKAAQRPPFAFGRPIAVEFGHVDYRVYLKIDGREVLTTGDAEYSPHVADPRVEQREHPISIRVAAQNLRLKLRHLRIDRDIHYTRSRQSKQGHAGKPFTLRGGEFFVLGDNSPNSEDSREWVLEDTGPHLPPDYRPGTVQADQIVGQAAFVYLPGLLPLDPGGRWLVPDLGRVRFIR